MTPIELAASKVITATKRGEAPYALTEVIPESIRLSSIGSLLDELEPTPREWKEFGTVETIYKKLNHASNSSTDATLRLQTIAALRWAIFLAEQCAYERVRQENPNWGGLPK